MKKYYYIYYFKEKSNAHYEGPYMDMNVHSAWQKFLLHKNINFYPWIQARKNWEYTKIKVIRKKYEHVQKIKKTSR